MQKCLQPVKDAERSGSGERRAGRGDVEGVRLIFAKLLDGLAGVVGVDSEDRRGLSAVGSWRHSRLAGERLKKALHGGVETRLLVSCEANRELLVNGELS